MKQETNRKLKPRLRFPEFRNAPEWAEKPLEEVFDFHSTANNSRADLSSEGDTFYIHYGDIHTKFHSYVDFSKDAVPKIASTLYRNATFLENGDLIIADASEDTEGIAKAIEVRGLDDSMKAISGLHTILLRDSHKQYVEGFRGLLRGIDKVKNQIQRLAVGVKVYAISKMVLKKILLPLPSPQEQQKIADCLASIDELIVAQTQKLDTLNAHKKGLLQQLFPAEGEILPRLRFPAFQDALAWEEKKLGQIGDILMCKRIFTEETNDSEGIPFYKIGTLGSKPNAFISKKLFDEYRSKYNFPRKGEILITCSGTVGKCFPYDGKDAYYQDSNIVWIDNPTLEVSNEFLYNILLNVNWEKLNSTTITRIYGSDLRNLSIIFPANQSEQQKIADCLASIDELITAHGRKLDVLKAHKKGLMQQLFPSADEVEG